MPISYAEAIDDACTQATDKVATLRSPLRYAALSATMLVSGAEPASSLA